jgi:hypothetical protein
VLIFFEIDDSDEAPANKATGLVPDCGVVYFDSKADSVFKRTDLTVRVTQKERGDSTPLCYCFGYSVGDVRWGKALILCVPLVSKGNDVVSSWGAFT